MFTGLNTPEDYFRVIKNHKWMIIVPIVLCVSLAAGVMPMAAKDLSVQHAALLSGTKGEVREGCRCSRAGSRQAGCYVGASIDAMKEVLYKRELLTQVAEEFHLYGYDKENSDS